MSLDLRATMVADASGPAALLARHLSDFEVAPLQSFSTNSYWAYFSLKSPVPAEKWSKDIGKNICFEDGWMWNLTTFSWATSKPERLDAEAPGRCAAPVGCGSGG